MPPPPGRRTAFVLTGTIIAILIVLAIFWVITAVRGDPSNELQENPSEQSPSSVTH